MRLRSIQLSKSELLNAHNMRSFGKPSLFSVPTFAPQTSGSTQAYRNVKCLTENEGQICGTFDQFPEVFTLRSLLDELADSFSAFPMYGSLRSDGTETEWVSFSEFYQLVKATVTALQRAGIRYGDLIAVLADNCVYFPLAQWALAYLGAVMVPIDPNYDLEVIEPILSVFRCKCVIVTPLTYGTLHRIAVANPLGKIEKVMLFCDDTDLEKIEEEEGRIGSDFGVPVFNLPDMLNDKGETGELVPLLANTLCVLNVGAGRCGSLNPCCLSHSNLIAAAAGVESCGYRFGRDVYLSTISMTRVFERTMQLAVLARGGCVGFCNHVSACDAMCLLRPTVTAFSADRIQDFSAELVGKASRSNCVVRMLYDFAFSVAAQSNEGCVSLPWFFRAGFIEPFRDVVGGRLRIIFSSCCDLQPRVQHILRTMLQIPVLQIYGTTEAAGIICIQKIGDNQVANVGAPASCCEIMIRDFEPGRQHVEDSDPGEILVRGPNVFSGYHRNRALTRRHLSSGGWFATGDIGYILSDGTIEIVDTIADWERRHRAKK